MKGRRHQAMADSVSSLFPREVKRNKTLLPTPTFPTLLLAKVAPVENTCRSSSFFPSFENLHPLFVLMQTFNLMCRDDPTQK